MPDVDTLIAALDFGRARLLGLLETMEKSGQPMPQVLAWRPGPGRAHIGWQFMHCAATLDRYVNVRLKGGAAVDPALCDTYGGGSMPADDKVPTVGDIRAKLDSTYAGMKAYVRSADLAKVTEFPNNMRRTAAESIILLTWHEAHHQGQLHLTWNLYKAAHGMA